MIQDVGVVSDSFHFLKPSREFGEIFMALTARVITPGCCFWIFVIVLISTYKLSSSFIFVSYKRDVPSVHASAVIVFPSPRDNRRQ